MSGSEILEVRIVLGPDGRPVIDRPHLRIPWDQQGEIWFEIHDSPAVFESPGILFQPDAPYALLPGAGTQRIKYSFNNDDKRLTGIRFPYTVHIVGVTGIFKEDPTVENDPPGTPPVD